MTKRRYTKEIEKCGKECPFFTELKGFYGCYLKKKDPSLAADIRKGEFPSWCPLEEESAIDCRSDQIELQRDKYKQMCEILTEFLDCSLCPCPSGDWEPEGGCSKYCNDGPVRKKQCWLEWSEDKTMAKMCQRENNWKL